VHNGKAENVYHAVKEHILINKAYVFKLIRYARPFQNVTANALHAIQAINWIAAYVMFKTNKKWFYLIHFVLNGITKNVHNAQIEATLILLGYVHL
jgi:hypothetical protein